MMQGQNGRRPRGRHHGGGDRNRGHGGGGHTGGGGNGNGGGGHTGGNGGGGYQGNNNRPRSAASLRHQTFDSNCIDVRVRGNAWQVNEKYQALARDASSSGDRVAAENYLQHAEHYYRIIEAINEATAAEQPQQQRTSTGPQTPYGQQPEVPPNYYGSTGGINQAPGNPAGDANGNGNGNSDAVSADGNSQPAQNEEATVQRPTPPAPFFAPEEIDEHHAPEQVAARR